MEVIVILHGVMWGIICSQYIICSRRSGPSECGETAGALEQQLSDELLKKKTHSNAQYVPSAVRGPLNQI